MSSQSLLTAPVTVGLVGLGRAGWNLHFKPMHELHDFKIVAVADPLPERCQEAADLTGCATFSNIDELLAGSDAQVVVVATPSLTHYSDTLKVLEAGRHCITEKPLTLETAEADELVSVAQKKGLHLFVHHTFLHRPEYHHFKAVINSGILGELYSLRISWANYARRMDWQSLRKNGGGQLNNTCPHILAVALPLLGAPVEHVFADMRNIKDSGDAEDHVHMVLQTGTGVTADIVVSSAMALAGPKWMLFGTRGALFSDGETSKLRFYDGDKAAPVSILDGAAPERKYLGDNLPWQEKEVTVEPAPVKPFHENVLDVLTGNAEPIVTPESAAEVVRVMQMARSSAQGNWS
jgi:scyllo-inositol 2-dehydrogenase (NADP+)